MARRVVKNGSRHDENGWIRVDVSGSPREIGRAHGALLSNEISSSIRTLDYVILEETGIQMEVMADIIMHLYGDRVKTRYPDLMEEIESIVEGARSAGSKVTLNEVFLWNCWYSIGYVSSRLPALVAADPVLTEKYGHIFADMAPGGGGSEGGGRDRCTGFIAVGDWTADGKIVCGHNTFDNFIDAQGCNVMMAVRPSSGNSWIMQTSPGCVASGTDYYVTNNGFIVTETTIGGFNAFKLLDPVFCRIRKAVQRAKTLDDFTDILKDGNGGDYANSWLVGDIKNNEIMRIELGLNYVNVEKKKNGYFIGFNAPYDARIRNLECSNTGFNDIRRHQGARQVRLEQLMTEHKGKLNIGIGQDILADHYDVYLNKENMCSRTCCSHYDLDQREYMSQAGRPLPYQPRGALDGIVTDSQMAKRMGLSARWGSSCGTPFIASEFCARNIQWAPQLPYLVDRPFQPWTHFYGRGSSKATKSKRVKRSRGTRRR